MLVPSTYIAEETSWSTETRQETERIDMMHRVAPVEFDSGPPSLEPAINLFEFPPPCISTEPSGTSPYALLCEAAFGGDPKSIDPVLKQPAAYTLDVSDMSSDFEPLHCPVAVPVFSPMYQSYVENSLFAQALVSETTNISSTSIPSLPQPFTVSPPLWKPFKTCPASLDRATSRADERRRRNRESSARCYYNRKRKIAERASDVAAMKRRAVILFARELELRNENARLKKELVHSGGSIPRDMLIRSRKRV